MGTILMDLTTQTKHWGALLLGYGLGQRSIYSSKSSSEAIGRITSMSMTERYLSGLFAWMALTGYWTGDVYRNFSTKARNRSGGFGEANVYLGNVLIR